VAKSEFLDFVSCQEINWQRGELSMSVCCFDAVADWGSHMLCDCMTQICLSDHVVPIPSDWGFVCHDAAIWYACNMCENFALSIC